MLFRSHGEALEKPVQSWFHFSMPNPSVGKKFIQNHLISYENDRNKVRDDYNTFLKPNSQYLWIAGKPCISERKVHGVKNISLQWIFLGGLISVDVDITDKDERETLSVIVENLWKMRAETAVLSPNTVQNPDENQWKKSSLMQKLYPAFRTSGIIRL